MPALAGFASGLGPMAVEAMAAMAEGDVTWDSGETMPPAYTIQQEVSEISDSFRQALPQLLSWRLSIHPFWGLGHDRALFAVITTIDELTYYESFPMLGMLRSGL